MDYDLRQARKDSSKRFISYIPIRLVTIIENVFRGVIKELIDGDRGCKENGAKFLAKTNSKNIADIVVHLDAKMFTLGDVISNVPSCSKIDDIISTLEVIYGPTFKVDLIDSRERWIEDDGRHEPPFIADPDLTFSTVAKLFEVRHIVVHELPKVAPYNDVDLDNFIDHARRFTSSLSWIVPFRLFGVVPRSQRMMNILSWQRAAETERELLKFVEPLPPVSECIEDYDHHMIWGWFADRLADARSGYSYPRSGSMAPMLFGRELERLNRWRLEDLQNRSDRFSLQERIEGHRQLEEFQEQLRRKNGERD